MKTFKVTVDGQPFTVQVEELKESGENSTDSQPAAAASVPAPAASPAPAAAAKPAETPAKQESPQPAASGAGFTVKAPMPGSVINVVVNEGDVVKDGDVLLILEAMKMENELTASQAGTVSQVMVKKGDTVNSGDPLVVLS